MATRVYNPSWTAAAEVLSALLSRLPGAGRLQESRVWEVWEEAVGAVVAREARPSRMQNGKLFVTVSNSVWMQEMQFRKALIKDKVNQHFGRPIVKDIFFVLGRVHDPMPQVAAPPRYPLPPFEELAIPALGHPELEAAFTALLATRRRRLLEEKSGD